MFGKKKDLEPLAPRKKNQAERRKYLRIKKNFMLKYFEKAQPQSKFEITQLKNISLGGMCFVTSQPLAEQLVVGIELRTPYISDSTYLEGVVLESQEKIKDVIYETRVQFSTLDKEAELLLNKLIKVFEHEK